MAHSISYTNVQADGEYEVRMIEHRAVFGLVKWYEKVSETHYGDDLYIETERPIRKIYFNGKVILRNNKYDR